MSQSEKYNPNSITQLVRDRIDKQARGEFVQLKAPSSANGKSVFSPSGEGGFQQAPDDLVTEFTASLLGQSFSLPKTDTPRSRQGLPRFDTSTHGATPNPLNKARTNQPVNAFDKQELSVSSAGLPVGSVQDGFNHQLAEPVQSFDLDTDYAGRVGVNVRRNASGIELTLSIRKELTLKGQDVLARLLKTQLGSNLGLPVEVRINTEIQGPVGHEER
jgi:hypothetical protein